MRIIPIRLFAIWAAVLLTALMENTSARAAYTIAFNQVGNDVVAVGSGTLNVTGLSNGGSSNLIGAITPNAGRAVIGQVSGSNTDFTLYFVNFSSSAVFGSGGFRVADAGTGGIVGLYATNNYLLTPYNYVSGTAIQASSTFLNQTFSSLGLTVGTYTYTYGVNGGTDSITVQVGAASVPEPASMVMVALGLVGVGVVRLRRRS